MKLDQVLYNDALQRARLGLDIHFNPSKHRRGFHGRFIDMPDVAPAPSLANGQAIGNLTPGTTVRTKTGKTFKVHKHGKWTTVHPIDQHGNVVGKHTVLPPHTQVEEIQLQQQQQTGPPTPKFEIGHTVYHVDDHADPDAWGGEIEDRRLDQYGAWEYKVFWHDSKSSVWAPGAFLQSKAEHEASVKGGRTKAITDVKMSSIVRTSNGKLFKVGATSKWTTVYPVDKDGNVTGKHTVLPPHTKVEVVTEGSGARPPRSPQVAKTATAKTPKTRGPPKSATFLHRLPDGTLEKRTSKTKYYTHVVVITDPQGKEAVWTWSANQLNAEKALRQHMARLGGYRPPGQGPNSHGYQGRVEEINNDGGQPPQRVAGTQDPVPTDITIHTSTDGSNSYVFHWPDGTKSTPHVIKADGSNRYDVGMARTAITYFKDGQHHVYWTQMHPGSDGVKSKIKDLRDDGATQVGEHEMPRATSSRITREAHSFPAGSVKAAFGEALIVDEAATPDVQGAMADMELLPSHIAKRLADRGVKVHLSNRSVPDMDDAAHLRNVQPRGYRKGLTWKDSGGAYSPMGRWVMAGTRQYSGSESTILHELGHAIGDVYHLDNDPELWAHQKRLYPKLGQYYRQGGRGGRAGSQELLAESTAVFLKGGEAKARRQYDDAYIDWLKDKLGG